MTDGLSTTHARVAPSCLLAVLSLGVVLVVGSVVWTKACRAQSLTRAEREVPVPSPSKGTERPSFGRLLGGSALGVPVGMGAGLLLLRASAEADAGGDRYDRREDPEAEAAAAIGLIGVAAIVAGGPVGAVEVGGIEHRRRDAYVAAGFGELIVGALGTVLAGELHDSRTARAVGLGTGMMLGSAGGAYLVATQPRSEGMFDYEAGHWQLGPPQVQVRPHLGTDRRPSVTVTLVSAEL